MKKHVETKRKGDGKEKNGNKNNKSLEVFLNTEYAVLELASLGV